MTRRTMTALALALLASGCGNGGGNGSSNSTSAATTPATPSPSPTPAPSPSPTPSPTSFTYEQAIGLRQDRTWTGYDLVSASLTNDRRTSAELSSSDTAVTSFTNATGAMTLAGFEDLSPKGAFGPSADWKQSRNDAEVFYLSTSATAARTEVGIYTLPSAFKYLIVSSYDGDKVERGALIGSPTFAADLARFTSRTYQAAVGENFDKPQPDKRKSVVIDLAKGAVSGKVIWIDVDEAAQANGKPRDVEVELSGTIDKSNHITGTTRMADGSTGSFRGRLYGPAGAELGLLVTLKVSDGYRVNALRGLLQ
jgi:hypothetical protein